MSRSPILRSLASPLAALLLSGLALSPAPRANGRRHRHTPRCGIYQSAWRSGGLQPQHLCGRSRAQRGV